MHFYLLLIVNVKITLWYNITGFFILKVLVICWAPATTNNLHIVYLSMHMYNNTSTTGISCFCVIKDVSASSEKSVKIRQRVVCEEVWYLPCHWWPVRWPPCQSGPGRSGSHIGGDHCTHDLHTQPKLNGTPWNVSAYIYSVPKLVLYSYL